MDISSSQYVKMPAQLKNLDPLKKKDELDELTENDNLAISSVKNSIVEKKPLGVLLEKSSNWRLDIENFIRLENKGVGQLSDKGSLEIIKLIIGSKDANSRRIIMNMRNSGISDEAAIVEIAKVCIENSVMSSIFCFEQFGIRSQAGAIDFYKHCIENGIAKNAKTLIESLPRFGITDQKELTAIILRIADFRPDLVLKNIDNFDLKDENSVHEVILKCTHQPHSPTSKLIEIWINENKNRLFSIPNFPLEKIPNAIEIQPNSEMQKIFNLFKSIAENSEIELIGRKCWSTSQTADEDYLIDMLVPHQMSEEASGYRCLTTNTALEAAIFGVKENDPQLNKLFFDEESLKPEKLNEFWLPFKENENNFEGKPISHFFAYSIDCGDIDHTFIVIQHKDEQGNIKYRILQSWVDEHSLNDYMTKRGNDLTSKEFIDFTEGFNHVFLDKPWTHEKRVFYEKYFMKDEEERDIGENHFTTNLGLKWGASNLDAVLVHKAEFETFKENHIVKSMK